MSAETEVRLKAIRAAARELSQTSKEQRNKTLLHLAQALKTHQTEILEANSRDLQALPSDATLAFRD